MDDGPGARSSLWMAVGAVLGVLLLLSLLDALAGAEVVSALVRAVFSVLRLLGR